MILSKLRSGFFPFFLLAATCAGGSLREGQEPARISYTDDAVFVRTTVDIAPISAGPVTLRDIFTLVEQQTSFEFVYLPSQLPLDTRVAVEAGSKLSLSDLFSSLTLLTDVVFQRRDRKIIVRNRRTRDLLSWEMWYIHLAPAGASGNAALAVARPGGGFPGDFLWT
ncbi:hypothetical protein OpiT1DRAFT_03789 [Opitutaceae bacterium TAV1]|nr:hypothetical protein OpiT1DRAFT_03777 [Opitutaceae bacterium TAV1]EIP99276.1 hypothetical protein OpiT1DRAFT_03789 [Opitutaceae bacterium TAV1]